MTVSATRRATTVYVSQVSMRQVHPTHFVVTSVPHPIHHADIMRLSSGRWRVLTTSLVIPRTLTCDSLDMATSTGADWVSRLAGRDLNGFSGAQRTAMGQQLCPRIGADGMCVQAAGIGTVWCPDHPNGKRRE